MAKMRTIKDITGEGTYDPGAGQNLWWPSYDRLVLNAADDEYIFYAQQVGSGKKKSQTNNTAAGQMAANVLLEVQYMSLYYTPPAFLSSDDYDELIVTLSNSYFEFMIDDKSPQYTRPLDMVFGNVMPLNVVNTTVDIGQNNLGRSVFNSVIDLMDIPIILAEKCGYSPRIKFDVPVPTSMVDSTFGFEMVGERISG